MEFAAAVERAMTYQQVIKRALAGTGTWHKAAPLRERGKRPRRGFAQKIARRVSPRAQAAGSSVTR